MESAISKNVTVAGSAGGRKIKIEGNCDEFGTDEYNYALGLKRAKAVKDSMSSQGVNTKQHGHGQFWREQSGLFQVLQTAVTERTEELIFV